MRELPPQLKILEHHKKFEGKIPHLKKAGAENVNGDGRQSSGSTGVSSSSGSKLSLPKSTTLTMISRPGEVSKREPYSVLHNSKPYNLPLSDSSLARKISSIPNLVVKQIDKSEVKNHPSFVSRNTTSTTKPSTTERDSGERKADKLPYRPSTYIPPPVKLPKPPTPIKQRTDYMSAFNAFLQTSTQKRLEQPTSLSSKRKPPANVDRAPKQPTSNRYNDELSMPPLRPSSVVANTVPPTLNQQQTVKCRTIETSAGPIQIVVRKHPEPEPQAAVCEQKNVPLLSSVTITPNSYLNVQHQPPEQLLQPPDDEPPQLIPFEEMQQFRYFDAAGNEIPGPCQPSIVYEETVIQSSPMISTEYETTSAMLTSFDSTPQPLQPDVINCTGTGFAWSNNHNIYLNERLVEYNH